MAIRTKIYAGVAATALVGAVFGLKSCSDNTQREINEKSKALSAAPRGQQLSAVKVGSAFVQCRERLTGYHYNVIPADAGALSALLQPATGCDLHLGHSAHPEIPLWKATVNPVGKLEYMKPQ